MFTGAQPPGLSIALSPNFFKEWPQQGVPLGCQQSSLGSVGGFRVGKKVQGQSLELVHPYLEAGPRPEDAAAWSSTPSLEQASQDEHPQAGPPHPVLLAEGDGSGPELPSGVLCTHSTEGRVTGTASSQVDTSPTKGRALTQTRTSTPAGKLSRGGVFQQKAWPGALIVCH